MLGHRFCLGRGLSSPQLRSPPRSGDLEFTVITDFFIFFEFSDFVFPTFGVRPRTTPLLVFIFEFVVSLSLPISVTSFGTALIFSHALAEMPEDYVLCV